MDWRGGYRRWSAQLQRPNRLQLQWIRAGAAALALALALGAWLLWKLFAPNGL